MNKEHIIQLRDAANTIINAKIINGMLANNNCSAETLIKSGYTDITLFIGDKEKIFIYEIDDEIDYKHYCEDADRIRFALNKIGGNIWI